MALRLGPEFPMNNAQNLYNKGVETFTSFLKNHDRYEWKIVIADNNSNDNTGNIGRELESENPLVQYLHITQLQHRYINVTRYPIQCRPLRIQDRTPRCCQVAYKIHVDIYS